MTPPQFSLDPGVSDLAVGIGAAIIGAIGTVIVAIINRVGKKRSEETDKVASFVEILQSDNEDLRREVRELRGDLSKKDDENDRLRAIVVGQINMVAAQLEVEDTKNDS